MADGGFPVAIVGTNYKQIPASSGSTVLGTTGAVKDVVAGIIVIPTTTSPGAITLQDGTGTAITIFAGGSSSLSNLVPFGIPLGMAATGVGWKISTGDGLSVIAVGNFT